MVPAHPHGFCMGVKAFSIRDGLDNIANGLQTVAVDDLNRCSLAEMIHIETGIGLCVPCSREHMVGSNCIVPQATAE